MTSSTSSSGPSLNSVSVSAAPYSPMGSQYDMPFTPMLPSQLLLGSPFQPGTPAMGHFGTFPGSPVGTPTPQYPSASVAAAAAAASYLQQQYYSTHMDYDNHSRTVYLGNVPVDVTAEQLLNHVRSGVIENVKLVPEKNCAFVSFLDYSSAAHFHADAVLKKLTLNGQEIKIGWGRSSLVPAAVSLAVAHEGASRNVYLGNLPEGLTEAEIRTDLSKFGPIDTVKLIREKNIGFVHFYSISTAIKVVSQLPNESQWASRKVNYGKDRCAYVSKTQQQNAAQYLGIAPGYEHLLANVDRELLSSALAQQSAAAVAVATTAGGANNIGNRTIYLGNVHPETTVEEICNVVRGGLLHNIRYIAEKHICFVTFIDPTAAAQFFAMANLHGLSIHNRRLKVGWGKHSGPLLNAISLAVAAGASRNVYIGNIDESWPELKLRRDFSEFGDIEQINFLPEKSCAFVNFTDITNAIKAIEGIKEKEEYKQFKINFGKDRCGNPPRFLQSSHRQQQQQQPTESIEEEDDGKNENRAPKFNAHAEPYARYRRDGSSSGTGSEQTSKRGSVSAESSASSPPVMTSTPGSHVLAQYLSQAQHEHYMYALSLAAAADQARYQQQYQVYGGNGMGIRFGEYGHGAGYDSYDESHSTEGSAESKTEVVSEDEETPGSEDDDADDDEVSTVSETVPAKVSADTKETTVTSTVEKLDGLKIEGTSPVYGLAIES